MKARYLLLALACEAALAGPATQRDPFARPAPPAAASPAPDVPKPQLRAIMFEPGHSLADINGQILAVGDWLGDYRVATIGERSVILSRRGADTVLALDTREAR